MKFYEKKTWLLAFAIGCIAPVMGQETIWSENFDMQTDGLDNGNYGPITSANGKWNLTLINQGGIWTGSSDYIKVNNDLIEARDTDNRGEWSSVPIDISGHSNVSVSIDMSEHGSHEVTDTLAAYYTLDGGVLTAFDTNGINVDDFTSLTASTAIPSGSSLQVFVHLKNNSGSEYLRFDNVLVTGTAGVFVPDPEPTNHVSNIGFTNTTDTEFTVNWADADGTDLPSGYLVKISEAAIVAPTDGTAEPNGAMLLNIAQGVQTATFSALTENTTYNVAIFPYSNSGSNIDYKLTPANSQITTSEAPPAPMASVVFISEIADPNNSSNGRYVELYNNSASAVDLSGWKLQRYTNDTATPSSPLVLSGTIGAYSTFIVGKSTFSDVYGFEPQMNSSNSVVDSNGDDNIELLDSSDLRADIFGVPGEDGSGTDHEFEDGRAERNANITSGNTTYTASEWTVDNDSGGGDGPVDAPDGFDPGTWIGGGPTQLAVSVNTNEDNYQLAANEALTISNGARLTISNGGQLDGTVTIAAGSGIELTSGTLTNTNTIILEDGAYLYENGGTLNNTGSFTVKRNTTLNTNAFNFLSSPVVDADIQAALVGSNVISYNPTAFVSDGMGNTNNFTAWVYHTSGTLEEAKGYAVSGSQTINTGVRSFSGTPNTGNQSIAVLTSNNSNPNGESWNLIGNPYPSPIQIGDFLTANTTVIENGVYLWDNSVDDYVTKNSGMNGTDFIAVGQGFFVQAKTDNIVSFTNSMRRGNTATFYRRAKDVVVDIIITDAMGKKNITSVAVAEQASDGKDALYDSKKMFGNHQLSIYSLLSDDAYALQGVSNGAHKQIPIGIKVANGGVFELAIKGIDFTSYKVLIEDKDVDTIYTLENNNLQILLEEGTHNDRFVLHLKRYDANEVLSLDQEIAYTIENGVLSIRHTNSDDVKVILTDMSGRLVRVFKGLERDLTDLSSGTYFIEMRSSQGVKYSKIIL